MKHRSYHDTVFVDVDDVARGSVERESLTNVFLSVFLQSPYNEMPEEIKKCVVVAIGNVINGKYCLEKFSVGDVISLRM